MSWESFIVVVHITAVVVVVVVDGRKLGANRCGTAAATCRAPFEWFCREHIFTTDRLIPIDWWRFYCYSSSSARHGSSSSIDGRDKWQRTHVGIVSWRTRLNEEEEKKKKKKQLIDCQSFVVTHLLVYCCVWSRSIDRDSSSRSYSLTSLNACSELMTTSLNVENLAAASGDQLLLLCYYLNNNEADDDDEGTSHFGPFTLLFVGSPVSLRPSRVKVEMIQRTTTTTTN